MRCAERFIHSMPCGPTVTMPTSTESRIARVRSACSATVCAASSLRCCARCCSVMSSVTTEVVRLPEASVAGSTRVSSQRAPSSGWSIA